MKAILTKIYSDNLVNEGEITCTLPFKNTKIIQLKILILPVKKINNKRNRKHKKFESPYKYHK